MSPAGVVLARVRRDDMLVAPVAVLVGVLLIVLAARDGGFDLTIWLPIALFLTLLLALALWFVPVELTGVERAALAALAALTIWTAASIAWAEVRGDAWTGGDRMFFYLVLFALMLVLPWRQETAVLFVSVFSIGVTVVSLWQFLRVVNAPEAMHGLFVVGRLATPISYPNADCALLLMAALPALILACLGTVPIVLRGVLLAAAGVGAELAIACQSRMSLIALPLLSLLLAVVVRWRVRLFVFAAPLVAVVAVSAPTVLRLYDATLNGLGVSALVDARSALLLSAVVLLIVGWLLAALDSRLELDQGLQRAASIAVAFVVAAGLVAVIVLGQRAAPHPLRSVHTQWQSFVHGDGYSSVATSHFISSGTNRYDIWRVAAHEFTAHPALGVGADNFAVDYLRERRSAAENPLYPHSLPLRLVSQTGVVGALAFLVFLGAAVAATWRRAGRPDPTSVAVTACLLPFAYFFVHGAVDWFWEIPALGAPAIAFLALAVRLGRGETSLTATLAVPRAALATGAVFATAALALPWLSARETTIAGRDWVGDLRLAYDRLSLAARLNPLSDLPAQTEGLIAARSNDLPRARAAFGRALDRNPVSWYSHFELAIIDGQSGRLPAAREELALARALDPKELVLSVASRRLRAGRPMSQAAVDALLASQDESTRGAR